MESVSGDWLALLVLTVALGLRHGLDPDHLAAVDGLTRANSRARPTLAPWCGALFALGHGAVVVAVAVSVARISGDWRAPAWAETFGVVVSITVLLALGLVNLLAVVRARPGTVVRPAGLKGRLLGSLQRTSNPWLMTLVGALFALSLDTLGQASLFAAMGSRDGDWRYALILGVAFAVGMLVTDGINGLWISKLIHRADSVAQIASRATGLLVAMVSLSVAGLGAARYFSPAVDAWSEGEGVVLGVALVVGVSASFLLALWLDRPGRSRSWSET